MKIWTLTLKNLFGDYQIMQYSCLRQYYLKLHQESWDLENKSKGPKCRNPFPNSCTHCIRKYRFVIDMVARNCPEVLPLDFLTDFEISCRSFVVSETNPVWDVLKLFWQRPAGAVPTQCTLSFIPQKLGCLMLCYYSFSLKALTRLHLKIKIVDLHIKGFQSGHIK